MGKVEWDKKLETGNRVMDSQHESLIQKLNACIEASKNDASQDECIALLEGVLRALEQHIHDEEMIFLEYGQLTKSHFCQHAFALKHFDEQIALLKLGKSKELSVLGVAYPMYDWCVSHSIDEDTLVGCSH